ncbi:DUF6586 family protein [Gilvimarinus xylanilyticus]|uniref:Uncharacterized protein n=1 Tax=Gilvimarinus xylanilyticus TaxID=2944139 RepID=A0A9X2KTI5_9GAMM|nr:DUF6586 family protein [Gilvimarinus xylanilyticus]MCP8898813.1 hypothetical protein [Gilvimarinus xylanilyticus]
MAVSLVSLVNQRLACCRALLQDLPQARTPVHSKALLDACVFHLQCGYRHYVRELAKGYGVNYLAAVQDEQSAAKSLAQIDKTPAEIRELCHLAESPSSWLARLKRAWAEFDALPEAFAAPSANAIPVTNLDAQPSLPLDEQALLTAVNEFQGLIDRHRESTLEY